MVGHLQTGKGEGESWAGESGLLAAHEEARPWEGNQKPQRWRHQGRRKERRAGGMEAGRQEVKQAESTARTAAPHPGREGPREPCGRAGEGLQESPPPLGERPGGRGCRHWSHLRPSRLRAQDQRSGPENSKPDAPLLHLDDSSHKNI